MEVFYSLGNEWLSLGLVRDINNDVEFNIPYNSLQELQNIEIKLITHSKLPSTKTTLLIDALWIEVQKPLLLDEPTIPPYDFEARVYDKKIDVYQNAAHSCSFENFIIDFSSGNNQTNILTVKGGIGLLEIGSIPAGIDVRFDNQKYDYTLDGLIDTIPVTFSKKDTTISSNFSLPVVYTHNNKSVICQVNIIH